MEELLNEEIYDTLINLFAALGAGLAVWGCIMMVNSKTEEEHKAGLKCIKTGGDFVLVPYKVRAQLGV